MATSPTAAAAAIHKQEKQFSYSLSELLSGLFKAGVATSAATLCTNPLEVVKTRMQLQELRGGHYNSFATTTYNVVKKEGFSALGNGMQPALLRAVVYGSLRLGLYDPIKSVGQNASGSDGFGLKIASGLLSGSIAATVANPIEMIKVRMQSMTRSELNVSSSSRFRSIAMFMEAWEKEGLRAMFTAGLVPHVLRGAVNTASQLATYDQAKVSLKQMYIKYVSTSNETSFGVDVMLQFFSATTAGLVTTTATVPFDNLKTRMMTQKNSPTGNAFAATVNCAKSIFAVDGFKGFFKGWLPSYCRVGPHTVIVLMVYEFLSNIQYERK